MSDWISPNYPYKVIMVKGTSGNALNRLEYIAEAEPGTALATALWRIKKLIYDSTGFNTQILWADGDRNFDNSATDPSILTYS